MNVERSFLTSEEMEHVGSFHMLHEEMIAFFREIGVLVSRIPKNLDHTDDRLLLGVMSIALKAILSDLRSVEILLSAGYPLAASSVTSTIWEKSVIAQYVLASPKERLSTYMSHGSKRSLPWTMRSMVSELAKDDIPADSSVELESEKWYLQYVLLCSLKHPQATTLVYASEIHTDMDIPSRLLPATPDKSSGLVGVIGILALDAALAFLRSYSSAFCCSEFMARVVTTDKRLTSFNTSTYPLSEEVIPLMLQLHPGDVSTELVEWFQIRHGKPAGGVTPKSLDDL
jgi:hypothetical protein